MGRRPSRAREKKVGGRLSKEQLGMWPRFILASPALGGLARNQAPLPLVCLSLGEIFLNGTLRTINEHKKTRVTIQTASSNAGFQRSISNLKG